MLVLLAAVAHMLVPALCVPAAVAHLLEWALLQQCLQCPVPGSSCRLVRPPPCWPKNGPKEVVTAPLGLGPWAAGQVVPEVAAHLRPCYLAELWVALRGSVRYLEVLVLQAPVELLLRVVLMLLLLRQLLLLLQVLL